jgi:transcriptional regulator with XRE-family HTH domain
MSSNKLREFREKAGLSQVELARRANIASTNLSSIERGHLDAWPKARKDIANVLGVSESDIFTQETSNGNN